VTGYNNCLFFPDVQHEVFYFSSAVDAEDICHWQQLMQHRHADVAAIEAPMWWQRV
jgi:hypothetical protein